MDCSFLFVAGLPFPNPALHSNLQYKKRSQRELNGDDERKRRTNPCRFIIQSWRRRVVLCVVPLFCDSAQKVREVDEDLTLRRAKMSRWSGQDLHINVFGVFICVWRSVCDWRVCGVGRDHTQGPIMTCWGPRPGILYGAPFMKNITRIELQ